MRQCNRCVRGVRQQKISALLAANCFCFFPPLLLFSPRLAVCRAPESANVVRSTAVVSFVSTTTEQSSPQQQPRKNARFVVLTPRTRTSLGTEPCSHAHTAVCAWVFVVHDETEDVRRIFVWTPWSEIGAAELLKIVKPSP